MSLDSEQPDEAKLDTTEETQSEPSFWNGNPDELPEEIQPVYKNLQADYTRKAQEVAEQRKEAEQALALYNAIQSPDELPDVLQQIADAYGPEAVLSALGYAVDEEPDAGEDSYADPITRELEELRGQVGQLTQAQQQAQEEQMVNLIEANIIEQFNSLDDKLTEKEQEIITSLALAAQYQTPDGFPDVKKAYEDYTGVLSERQKQYVESKKAPRSPSPGMAGSEQFDWRNEEKRRELMAAMLEANDQ